MDIDVKQETICSNSAFDNRGAANCSNPCIAHIDFWQW